MKTVYLSLGANLGDRAATLQKALAALAALPGTELVKVSTIYETAPWGKTDQPAFLNLACQLATKFSPTELLRETQRIETALGRVRHEHWGARTIDIDLLLAPGYTSATAELTLPHPFLKQRAFVLVPLAEIAPAELLDGQPIKYWRDHCPDTGAVTPVPT